MSNKRTYNTQESLSRTTRNLMNVEPFYGLFLSSLNKTVNTDENRSVSGLTKDGVDASISINSEKWESLSEDIRLGVLKHELMHLAFMHLLMRGDFADKEIFDIAADIEVNQYIDPKNKNEMFLDINSFPGIKLEPKKGTQYYYNELLKHKGKNPKLDSMCSALAQCNAGQGKGSGQEDSLSNHAGWQEFDQLSETEKKVMKGMIESNLKQTAEAIKSRGTIPGELQQLIDKLFIEAPEIFDWKAYVRRFAGGSNIYYTKKTRRKESRRYSDSPGLKIKEKKHIMVAVDTSGSVSSTEFFEFMGQIHHIWKSGTKVTIVDADAGVADVKEYKGKFDGKRSGNGGTDFNPAIEYFNEHKEFCSLIYFTDGECVPPSIHPRRAPLWVISSVGHKLEGLPGIQIQIPKEN